MIIDLTKSVLFTQDPDIRFSKEHGVALGFWKELWKRHKLLEYTIDDMCDYYQMKIGHRPSRKSIKRWIIRSEIYSMSKPILNKGGRTVVSTYFKENEDYVIRELLKNLKNSVRKNPKTIV